MQPDTLFANGFAFQNLQFIATRNVEASFTSLPATDLRLSDQPGILLDTGILFKSHVKSLLAMPRSRPNPRQACRKWIWMAKQKTPLSSIIQS